MCTDCIISKIVGGDWDFHFRTMLSLAASRMWVTIFLVVVGYLSIEMFKIARAGSSGDEVPVNWSMMLNVALQKSEIWGQDHRVWYSVPMFPQPLQQRGEGC